MDRAAIGDLYAYLDFAWRQIVDAVGAAEDEMFTRPAPGSGWPALQDCLRHFVFAYDRWLSIMSGREPSGIADRVSTLAEIDAARSAARAEVDALLGRLSASELQEMRTFTIDGEAMPYRYGELLLHLALHERGHHGDLTTLLSQLALDLGEGLALEYRFHLGRAPVQ